MKWLIAIPVSTRGSICWPLVRWLLSLPSHFERGKLCIDICEGGPVAVNRNAIVRRFLATDFDVLGQIDCDMDPHMEDISYGGIELIKDAIALDDVDVFSGISFRFGEDGNGPVPCVRGERGREDVMERVFDAEPGLHRMDDISTGGACLFAKRHVLEDFRERRVPWFKTNIEEEDRDRLGALVLSEDLHFIRNASGFGHRFWVDTRVVWGHIKSQDMRDELKRTRKILEEVGA